LNSTIAFEIRPWREEPSNSGGVEKGKWVARREGSEREHRTKDWVDVEGGTRGGKRILNFTGEGQTRYKICKKKIRQRRKGKVHVGGNLPTFWNRGRSKEIHPRTQIGGGLYCMIGKGKTEVKGSPSTFYGFSSLTPGGGMSGEGL